MARIQRTAARVLPVSADGEVLLVQFDDPGNPGHPHWVSVGGGIDEGESAAQAAVREMWEETGVRLASQDLVGPIHRTDHDFSWNGADYTSDTTYFAAAIAKDVELSLDNLEEAEVGFLLQFGWWTPEKMRADGTGSSADLPDIMSIAVHAVLGGSQ